MVKPDNSFLLIPTRDLVNFDSLRKRLFRKVGVLDEFDVSANVVPDGYGEDFFGFEVAQLKNEK